MLAIEHDLDVAVLDLHGEEEFNGTLESHVFFFRDNRFLTRRVPFASIVRRRLSSARSWRRTASSCPRLENSGDELSMRCGLEGSPIGVVRRIRRLGLSRKDTASWGG